MKTSQNSNYLIVYAIMWLGFFLASIKFLVLAWAINDPLRTLVSALVAIVFLVMSHYSMERGFKLERERIEDEERARFVENIVREEEETPKQDTTRELLNTTAQAIKLFINSQGKKEDGDGRPKKKK